MRCLVFLFISLLRETSGTQINLTTINGWPTVQISLNAIEQKRNLVLDLTKSVLWTFASRNISEVPNRDFFTFILNGDVNNHILKSHSKWLNYTDETIYDNRLQFESFTTYVYGFRYSNTSLSTWIYLNSVLVNKKNFNVEWQKQFADGVIGVGRSLSLQQTNFFETFLNNQSYLEVRIPRERNETGRLLINETSSKCDSKNQVITNYTSSSSISSETFEFNISSVKIGNDNLVNQTMTATISTLTRYITVDPQTWLTLTKLYRLIYDPYKKKNWKNVYPHHLIACSEKLLDLRITVLNIFGFYDVLTIPGKDLITTTRSGFCILRIRRSTTNVWVLGVQWFRNFCVGINFKKQTLTFMNQTRN
ncbi:hypothetical protein M3Y95_00121900 [Aphelenchoides besseyi]|nr:hypothetical protein M3Y95_00121900 [Aphelenchoides besseyi]